MFTDINIYPINNKTDHISEKYWYFPDFRSDLEQDPDPLFHETDPRIRIHIKMKRIRNTDFFSQSLSGPLAWRQVAHWIFIFFKIFFSIVSQSPHIRFGIDNIVNRDQSSYFWCVTLCENASHWWNQNVNEYHNIAIGYNYFPVSWQQR